MYVCELRNTQLRLLSRSRNRLFAETAANNVSVKRVEVTRDGRFAASDRCVCRIRYRTRCTELDQVPVSRRVLYFAPRVSYRRATQIVYAVQLSRESFTLSPSQFPSVSIRRYTRYEVWGEIWWRGQNVPPPKKKEHNITVKTSRATLG